MPQSIDSPETIKSERDFLWLQCEKLYNAITTNGLLTAATFRQAVGLAGGMFQGKIDMTHSNTWFSAIGDFLEMFEKAKAQKIGPKC